MWSFPWSAWPGLRTGFTVFFNEADGWGSTVRQPEAVSELQLVLEPHAQFLRCHQSYLVNLDYVDKLEVSCFYMRDGQMIPISRNFL